ncbi:MAG: PAS domain-containing protein [Bacteroidia bacterium]|nr:PAS domain-containing protein [Bacteroidia bacterium]
MKKTAFVLLVFLLCVFNSVWCQQYNFTNYSVEQGLIQSQVTALFEDGKGYLWVGTNGGVSMFDGIRFINYDVENGLPDNQVRAVCEDGSNNIWVATNNGLGMLVLNGVDGYSGSKFKTYNTKDGLESLSILSLAKDSSGNIYAGTERKGLFVFKDNKFEKIPFAKGTSDLTVKSICIDHSGKIWIGTQDNGVFIYDNNSSVNLTEQNGLCDNTVNSVYEDNFKNIWIATKNGVSKYKGGKLTNYNTGDGISGSNVTAVATEKKGNIWFGTDQGISKFNGKGYIYYNKTNGLDNDNVTCLWIDRTMNVWVGTDRSGIYKYDGDRFIHLTMKDGLPNNIIMSIMEDRDKNLWFGTYGDGVCKYDRKKFTYYTTKDGLCSNVIYSIMQDKKGDIWFGSKGNGASKFDGKHFKTFNTESGLSSNMIYSIIQDNIGNILFGTLGGGLNIYDGKKITVITKKEGLSSNLIYFVFQDKKGNLFIGTDDKGVDMIFDICGSDQIIKDKCISPNRIINFSKKNAWLSNEQVLSITQDIDGNLWFGTYGGGICKFDGKDIKAYTQKDGLNSNNIFFLLADSMGYLWAGSEKGINRLFLSYKKKPVIKTYSKGEGYRGIESSLNAAIEDSQGYLWFATVKGVSRYDAIEDLPSPMEAKTRISDVKLFSENVNWATYTGDPGDAFKIPFDLTLPHDKNHLTFNFVGIDLKSPDKVKYQWILEGYDKQWSAFTTQQNSVTYSYIPDGEYVFKVRACTNDGVCNKIPASIHIKIKPPFWATWWFITFSVFLLALAIFLYMKLRYRYLERANKNLEEKIQIRTALLRHEKTVVEEQAKLLQSQKFKLEEINHELEKLSIVARETDNSVMIADAEFKVQWVNEGFHKLFGYDVNDFKDIAGMHISFTSSNKQIGNILDECIREKRSVVYIAESNTKTGNKIWVQTTLTPIFNPDGSLRQLVAIDTDISKIKLAEEQIKKEKEKSDTLLLNILPTETAEELKTKGFATPRSYKRVSVMFTDFKGFTKACENLKPEEIVNTLHEYFVKFDSITERYFLEKIKTIGDSYMCVGGLPIRNKSHPFDSVLAALEVQHFMNETNMQKLRDDLPTWELRLGIHTGEVVAGVVGKRKFAYDIWGDTVNIASRMESSGQVGMVNISGATYEYIKDYFDCLHRGKINAKNKGAIDMYFVSGIKKEYASDHRCIYPNEAFKQVLSEL